MVSGQLPTTASTVLSHFFTYRKKQIIIQNSKSSYEVASLLLQALHDWEVFMTNEKK